MKKNIISLLAVLTVGMMIFAGCSSNKGSEEQSAEAAETTETTEAAEQEIANPWTQSDEQGVAEATGFEIAAPEGATDVSYSYMAEGKMAQMTYVLNEIKWTYRMQMADALTDISGMEYTWASEEKGTVSEREAMYYSYCAPEDGTEDDVQVVNWYDVVPGVVYSLSATAKDLDGMDIQAYAESLFVPLQGEV